MEIDEEGLISPGVPFWSILVGPWNFASASWNSFAAKWNSLTRKKKAVVATAIVATLGILIIAISAAASSSGNKG